MITIIDYGLGNLASLSNAFKKLKIPVRISDKAAVLQKSTALILPGVGAAGAGIKNLKGKKLDQAILKQVNEGKPILGICLGMQLLFTQSDEGNISCLNLVKGRVKKFNSSLKVPQIGWNQVSVEKKSDLLTSIENGSYFYFVNSFYCDPVDKSDIAGKTEYGVNFCSVFEKDNIYGVQFHPEKSGSTGLKVLKNFTQLIR